MHKFHLVIQLVRVYFPKCIQIAAMQFVLYSIFLPNSSVRSVFCTHSLTWYFIVIFLGSRSFFRTASSAGFERTAACVCINLHLLTCSLYFFAFGGNLHTFSRSQGDTFNQASGCSVTGSFIDWGIRLAALLLFLLLDFPAPKAATFNQSHML